MLFLYKIISLLKEICFFLKIKLFVSIDKLVSFKNKVVHYINYYGILAQTLTMDIQLSYQESLQYLKALGVHWLVHVTHLPYGSVLKASLIKPLTNFNDIKSPRDIVLTPLVLTMLIRAIINQNKAFFHGVDYRYTFGLTFTQQSGISDLNMQTTTVVLGYAKTIDLYSDQAIQTYLTQFIESPSSANYIYQVHAIVVHKYIPKVN